MNLKDNKELLIMGKFDKLFDIPEELSTEINQF